MKKNIITLVGALMLITSQAFAFEGFSVGATYSSIDFSTSGTESTNNDGGAAEIATTTKTGSADIGSIFAEYTFSQGTTIGVESIQGSAEIGKASRTRTSVLSGNATVTAKATAKNPVTVYVEPTWMANDKFGIYLKGGATMVTISPSETDSSSVTASTYKDKDLYGIMTGIGAKYYMGNVFLKAEYVETNYDTYSFTSTTGDKNTITADVDTEETRVSIGYNF
jgi:predicted porin